MTTESESREETEKSERRRMTQKIRDKHKGTDGDFERNTWITAQRETDRN